MDNILKQASEKFVQMLREEENMRKLECEVLDPLVKYMGKRLWPYILSFSVILALFFIILVYLIHNIMRLQVRLQSQ